ncbi:LysR family transcriptional regulator [Thalassospira xiamenensis]|uniref:LysR family transcriptional regulator n=1 Tax=Thalassospira xiamenensis TaxID=220697 RepID=UPI000DEDCE34|nr:LysR family transcriptional regulator [Thalassospira xiamenensis]
MDRLDELEIFVAIANAGSLRQAALHLRKSPASITRALAQLEDRLGTRLLDRTTRRMAPTEAGQELLGNALELLDRYEALVHPRQAMPLQGLLRISAPAVLGRLYVAPALDGFLEKWPEIRAEMVLGDPYFDLIEHGIDLAIRVGTLADSGLRARRIGSLRWVTACSPDYLASQGGPKHPVDLCDHQTIAEVPQLSETAWHFHDGNKTLSVRLAPRLIADDTDIQLDAVRNGRGIGQFLSYQVAKDLESGALVRILDTYEPSGIPVHIVTKGGRHERANTRALGDWLFQKLGSRLTALEDAMIAGMRIKNADV